MSDKKGGIKKIDKIILHTDTCRIQLETLSVEAESACILCICQATFNMDSMYILIINNI